MVLAQVESVDSSNAPMNQRICDGLCEYIEQSLMKSGYPQLFCTSAMNSTTGEWSSSFDQSRSRSILLDVSAKGY